MLEVIAEINDLSCHFIETGDYQTALDALNCCLGCVKQLKNHRTKMSDRNGESGVFIADKRQSKTEEIVGRLLQSAKQKIMKRLATARTGASSVWKATGTDASAFKTLSGTKRASPQIVSGNRTRTDSTRSREKDVMDQPQNKLQRRGNDFNSTTIAPPASPPVTPNVACQSFSNTAHDCTISLTTPSANNNSAASLQNHNHKLLNNFDNEAEEAYFVCCKPFRMTKFQRARIAKCQYSFAAKTNGEKKEHRYKSTIYRETELAVSSNLIFNIALSHHLIAWSRVQKKEESQMLLFDNEESEDDVERDDENGDGYGSSSDSSSSCSDDDTASVGLRTEERLRGALRLYELGFRVHAKYACYISAAQPKSSLSGSATSTNTYTSHSASMRPSSVSILTNMTPVSASANALRGSPARLPSLISTHARSVPYTLTETTALLSSTTALLSSSLFPSSPSSSAAPTICQSDRDNELRSTTRFALAVLNNYAHIHEKLGHREMNKIFQERLLSFLLVIVDSGESIYDIIGGSEVADGYFKNALALTVFQKGAAPAAVA